MLSTTERTHTDVAIPNVVPSVFSAVDYVVFIGMLVVSLGIGVYSAIKSRGKESTQQFLLGGRNMNPVPVTLSLLGGVFSAISILGNATEVYYFGAQIMVSVLGFIPGALVFHQILIPVFYNLKILSLNEYIELRFKSPVIRRLATVCHLITKLFYMGICLYAPSLALSAVTGLSIWASMLSMGIVCTIYITIGGVNAVIYADVVQILIMAVGGLVVIVLCVIDLGPQEIWTRASQGGRLEFFNFDPSPFTRHTFWSTMMLGFYVTLTLALNQSCYQRLAAVRNLKVVQRIVLIFLTGMMLLWLMFYSSGIVAYAVYRGCDPLVSGSIEKPDQIIPFLVMDKLSHLKGLTGLFVAAVYGGVLSSLSTAGNSIACLIWEDLLQPWPYFARMSSRTATTICKLLSAVAGTTGIVVGILAGKLGNVFHVFNSGLGAILGPMQGIFITGILCPWATGKSVVVGFLVAFGYNLNMVVGKFYYGGGSPAKLPLSTDGCPDMFVNTTVLELASTTSATLVDASFLPQLIPNSTLSPATPHDSGAADKTMYDVSYCFFGITGILITVIISNIASLLTGFLKPGEVDARLVNASCARLYHRVWEAVYGPSNVEDKPLSLPMLSQNTASLTIKEGE